MFYTIKETIIAIVSTLRSFFVNATLLIVYLINVSVILNLYKIKFIPQKLAVRITKNYGFFISKTCDVLSNNKGKTISKIDLIDISIKNMRTKRARTLVTVFGVGVGFAAIVLLVSMGYGIQDMIIKRVAKLEALRQTDVVILPGSKLALNDESISKIKDFANVTQVIPVIDTVSKVEFTGASTDIAAYAVDPEYIKTSSLQLSKGRLLQDFNVIAQESSGSVKGAITEKVEKTKKHGNDTNMTFNIMPETSARVRKEPSTSSETLGYTQRFDGDITGVEIIGDSYIIDDITDNRWIKAEFPVKKTENDVITENSEGYIASKYAVVSFRPENNNNVLGIATEKTPEQETTQEDAVKINQISDEWVELVDPNKKELYTNRSVELGSNVIKEIIVNRAALTLLNVSEDAALDKKVNISFITNTEEEGVRINLTTNAEEYTIVGVLPESNVPIIYYHINTLKQLGLIEYSQLRVVSNHEDNLAEIRRSIEAIGYDTSSVVDTINKINTLFNSIRIILGIMGSVALTVAALGMFNTLTVSLLERTREIGLMKAMGMKSHEIQDLFLTESIIMGFSGGIIGLLLGYIGGKIISVWISVITVSKGLGFMNVSIIPTPFILLVLFLSFTIGVITGVYPARRATKISALDALRYE